LFLSFSESWYLACKAPSTKRSCLISFHCS
jgi:hypothetical protein